MTSGNHPRHCPIQPWVRATDSQFTEPLGLHYREFAPPPSLNEILVGIWTLTGQSSTDAPLDYHVVPDGCSDLIFNRQAGEGFIFGTLAASRTVRKSGRLSIVGVRLQPHLLPAFTGIPASELKDVEASFCEASIGDLNSLFERHAIETNGTTGIREAEDLARAVAQRLRPERVNPRAQWLTCALLDGGGSVDRAARTTGFSARQLQRISQQDLGHSPKLLGRILRLQQAFPAVLGTNEGHADIAAEHGYADQAHMIREFTTLTGYAPGFWRERRMSDLFNQNDMGKVKLPT